MAPVIGLCPELPAEAVRRRLRSKSCKEPRQLPMLRARTVRTPLPQAVLGARGSAVSELPPHLTQVAAPQHPTSSAPA